MKYCFFFFTLLSFFKINCQAVQLELLGRWRDPDVLGSSAYNNAFNEVYGAWVNNREYAIIGSTYGTHFIDVTNPTDPKEVYRVKGGSSGTHIIHRDYRTYQCYLYAVCDEGSLSTLQIMDLSYLPDSVHMVYDTNSLFVRSHNIYIDVPKARLYTSAETGIDGRYALGLYDISNPTQPKLLGHYSQFGNIEAGHVHDCYVINDTAYLNCGNDGFAVMDFSNYLAPKSLYTLTPTEYPFAGYNHSGWLTPDGSKYVMADETHGSPMKLIHFGDWSEIKITSLMGVVRDDKEIPHNPLVSCDYAYVSYYYDGLQVYDITKPNMAERKYYYPTSLLPNIKSYEGAWGVYPFLPSGNILVADMQRGLFVVKGVEKACNVVKTCQTISGQNDKSSESSDILIHPNPSQDQLNVSSKNPIKAIEIFTLTGQKIYSQMGYFNNGLNEINTQTLANGIYLIKVIMDNQVSNTYKFSILR
ncbi:MAG: choice-of-anchor B family protein [Saprospiraceae bacterium]|nr:choice-of-anchor B family protein [Saprospiraceae bacterium]MBK7812403.1 choice-of-anchor B family protein [Saprospiraceae bacterium]MBK9632372.1 choice-of-anchor B family protein [Saprospiraceae bacterium]